MSVRVVEQDSCGILSSLPDFVLRFARELPTQSVGDENLIGNCVIILTEIGPVG